ncbi:hypothetical protein [Pseudomonas extremaustralis]|uniref:Large polyvalent protein associated domain-containing protein n=1 Tax=Pseudomonas extremaustralis TaxID=359110 RepID=A0A5C5QPY2_9PSED|nr:hypothetical protein [Pseudomonas extremaustralis]EZI29596.1 hypothetical protein PE143B_0104055 [Pseudomonas extremaustralis 14-3 substr. 14-3b]TWS07044.1 hypothetical protein FIV36_03765 [Pseudomonas extremaustralis]SDF89694.1 hypothetical protein SAMN05216591_4294 [Pseudomonas extremaustralis]
MSQYDNILAGKEEPQGIEANKYDVAIQRQQSKPNPRTALSYVADTNPDEQASIQRLAELTGVAPDMVVRNRKQVERQAKLASVDYDALIERAPATNQFLTDPDNASVAHDDIDGLSNVEGAFDNFVKESGQQHSTSKSDALTKGFGQLGIIGEAGANMLDRALSSVGGFFVNALAPQSALDRNKGEEPNYTGRTESNITSTAQGYLALPRDQRIAFAGQIFDKARDGGAGVGGAASDTALYALRNPGLIGSALTESLPSLLAGGVIGGIAAQPVKNFAVSRLASTFAQRAAEKAIVVGGVNLGTAIAGGAGENLAEGLKKTGDLDQAYAYSFKRTAAEAAINALGGMVPIPFAGRGIAGKLGNVAVEGVAQAAGAVGGTVAGAAAVGEQATGGEMFLNAFLGLATSPVDVAIASASSGRRYWQIEKDLTAVQQLGDMAQNSKMFKRSPQRAEALVARLKEQAGGTVENILVPAEQFQRYFQENNLDPEQFAKAATGNPDALGEALALGADISIPLEKWASVIAKDGHHRGLEQDMRATPDAMTLRELAEFQQRAPEELERLRDRVEQDHVAASDRRVFEDVRGQLLGIGREAQTADREASLYQSAFRSLGERSGIDPYDLFNQYRLRIGQDIPEVLRKPGGSDQLDLLIDRLRAADVPDDAKIYGASLIDFIRERGGIRDDGGELAARDADVGRRGNNRISRKGGRSLDDMATQAAEAGYLGNVPTATPEMLLASLDKELRGQRQSAPGNLNQELLNARSSLDDLQRALDQSGLDLNVLDNTAVRKALLGSDAVRFDQSEDGTRGFIQFGADRKFEIKLTDKANLSTFLHETGHFYLEVMGDLASRTDVPDQVKQDYQTILDWFGVNERTDIKVDQHEQFARGFEAYLREGKAPSAALQSAFSRFKAWLTQIYRDASRLNVQLNDDVRRVFDRLLATDDEISVAQAPFRTLFSDAQAAGMSPNEFEAYYSAANKAGQAAEERLTAESLRELTREQEKWWKDAREKMLGDVTKEVDSQPVYRVQDYLRKGLQTDGTIGEPVKLLREPLLERYGKTVVTRLRGMTGDEGIHPDLVAEQFGYTSGDELVQALVGARARRELIQAETDARMRAEYGDMLNDGSLADRAIEAVHNDDRARVLREELRAIDRLRRQVDKVQRAQDADSRALRNDAYDAIPPLEAIRSVAKQVIADKVVRDIQPHLYLNAERKANRDAFNFATKNRWQEAAESKQRELLNHYLFREATAARKEEDRIYTFMRRFEKPATRERIGKAGANYLEQIEGLLDQYEFRKVSGPQVERRRSLAQFVREQEAAGNIVAVPQHLIEQSARVNYRELTFEELGGLRDAVANIEHMARLKNKLLNRKDKRDYEQARTDLIAALDTNVPVRARQVAVSESSETIGDKAVGLLQGLDASLTRMENVINRLDGRDTSGPWHQLIWSPLAEAQANERQLFNAGIRTIVERFADMNAERLADRFHIPSLGKSFNRRELIMHALNTGNESNRNKLLKGNKVDEASLADMLGRLDKQDWDLVQSVWDSFDDLWPDIAAMYKRLSGVEPPRIEPKPITTAFGEYRGGYFPIIYDRKRAGAPPAAVGGELFGEGFEGALPGNGFTNQRNESVSGPLLLDLSAIPQRLAQHVHDLTHREALQDAHRLTQDPYVRAVLINKLGPRGADAFLPWLRAIANDRNPPETGNFNQFLDTARTNTSIVGLGLSTTTLLAQAAGLIPGLLYVKPRELATALLEGVRSPVDTYRMITEASPAMRLRWDMEDGRLQSNISALIGRNAFFRKKADLVRFSFNLLGYLDRGISGAIWLAAYREGVAAGKESTAAVLDGDKAVRQSQGGTGAMDIAAIQRKDQGAAMRLLTMFYTPFSAYYNQNRDLAFEARQGTRTVASAAASMLALAFFQGVIGDLLTGKGPEEDENTAAWMAKSTLGFGVSGFPVIRDTIGSALSGHAGSLSPAWQAINAGRQLTSAVAGVASGDKDPGQVVKSAVTATGYLLGIPVKPLTRQGTYLWDITVGDEEPEDAAAFMKGLLTGKK